MLACNNMAGSRMMHDADGPDVARSFYERLFESEELDLDSIAYALDEAVTRHRDGLFSFISVAEMAEEIASGGVM
jgi:hypothetical protein